MKLTHHKRIVMVGQSGNTTKYLKAKCRKCGEGFHAGEYIFTTCRKNTHPYHTECAIRIHYLSQKDVDEAITVIRERHIELVDTRFERLQAAKLT